MLCPATKSLGMFRRVRQDHHLPHHFWGCKILFRIILMYHKHTSRSFWDDLPVFRIWTMKWRWLYSSSEVFKHVIYLGTRTNVAKLSSTAKQNDGWLGWGSELIRKVQLTKLRPNDQKWASPSDLTQSDVILSYFAPVQTIGKAQPKTREAPTRSPSAGASVRLRMPFFGLGDPAEAFQIFSG